MAEKTKTKAAVILRAAAAPAPVTTPSRAPAVRAAMSRKLVGALSQLAAVPRPPRRFPTD